MTEHRWTIREYAPGDESMIVALFERVFGKPMGPHESEAHWAWEYAENPVGPRMIELVWDEDRLVGQYAVSPRRLWVDGEPTLAALSLDTMTDPDYGRQGIFSASAEACYAAMSERGFAFVYGFPNANSVRGFERRLRWSMVMPTPVLVKPLDVGGFVAQKTGVPALAPVLSVASRLVTRAPAAVDVAAQSVLSRVRGRRSLEVRPFDAFEDWADELWERCRGQHRVWTVRDAEFLRWRYDARPESEYVRFQVRDGNEVAGYAVLAFSHRLQGLAAFIMDLVVDTEVRGAASALLRAIESHARAREASVLMAMAGPGSSMRRRLHRHAYVPLPERLFPQELYFGARALDASDTPIYDASAWHVTWGDIDVL